MSIHRARTLDALEQLGSDSETNLETRTVNGTDRKSETKAIVQIDAAESECIEIRFLDDPSEVVVLRHGMGYPEGGEAVYSELMDDPGE